MKTSGTLRNGGGPGGAGAPPVKPRSAPARGSGQRPRRRPRWKASCREMLRNRPPARPRRFLARGLAQRIRVTPLPSRPVPSRPVPSRPSRSNEAGGPRSRRRGLYRGGSRPPGPPVSSRTFSLQRLYFQMLYYSKTVWTDGTDGTGRDKDGTGRTKGPEGAGSLRGGSP